jgi:GWxTD domain-containing protein
MIVGQPPEGRAVPSATADSIRTAALPESGRTGVADRIRELTQAVREDGNHGPAYHELARLYLSLKTVQDRDKAHDAIRRALAVDPGNVDYQVTLGQLLWEKGFRHNAASHFKKVLEEHPEDPRAACAIGRYNLKEYEKYWHMIHAEEMVVVEWKHFAKDHLDEAVHHLKRSIDLSPDYREAYYLLGFAYLESEEPQKLIDLSHRLLQRLPEDKDGLLFCGLGHHAQKDYEEAHALYSRALQRMEPDERVVMESVDLIAAEDDPALSLDSDRSAKAVAVAWSDGPERRRFWRKRDPLRLTEFNERRMEHYRRVAYANLRFGQPPKGLEGWQTDMGRSYIKFGAPIHQAAQRPECDPRGRLVKPHLDTWYYEDFKLTFRNWDGQDRWRFDTTYREPPRRFARYEDLVAPEEIFERQSSRYVDPYRERKYSMPHQLAAFRTGDSVRVELSYAVPKDRLRVSERGTTAELQSGVFVYDAEWEEVYRHTEGPNKVRWPQRAVSTDPHLLSLATLSLKPGPYHVVVETREGETESVGTLTASRVLSFAKTSLAMSDVLLARRIEPKSRPPRDREDLEIVPNPLRTYKREKPLFLYLEVYNLKRNAFGSTSFEIAYRIGRPEENEIDPELFVAVDHLGGTPRVEIETMARPGGRRWDDTEVDYRVRYVLPKRKTVLPELERPSRSRDAAERTVTVQYEGDQADDLTYLEIDITRVPAGVYRLTVMVRDLESGERAERETLFRVVE